MRVEKIILVIKRYIPMRVFLFLRPPYHFLLALFAAVFYRFPSRHLVVMGVTGTKGKTTVVELVGAVLEENGKKIASLSSLGFKIGGKKQRNELKMTMPGRFFIQKFLYDAVQAGCNYAVLEVTSEGIKQFRHRFIKFDMAVMTNLAPEHIESHGNFEKYLRAKLDIFWRLPKEGVAVINKDDPEANRFGAATAAHKIWYGETGIVVGDSFWPVSNLNITEKGIEFEINKNLVFSPLLGKFNFYNILAVISIGLSQHVSIEKIISSLSHVSQIPGRLEFIQKEPFGVVVDYAHTPESLRAVYGLLKNQSQGKLICVLGAAGGGRDKWKRPEFGRIAAEFCDEIILTNEDSYDEDSELIIRDIIKGIPKSKIFQTKIDRREAIHAALKAARPGDMVIITGKGAEPFIIGPDGSKILWDDREAVREELKKQFFN